MPEMSTTPCRDIRLRTDPTLPVHRSDLGRKQSPQSPEAAAAIDVPVPMEVELTPEDDQLDLEVEAEDILLRSSPEPSPPPVKASAHPRSGSEANPVCGPQESTQKMALRRPSPPVVKASARQGTREELIRREETGSPARRMTPPAKTWQKSVTCCGEGYGPPAFE